jgi:hypothetical protein
MNIAVKVFAVVFALVPMAATADVVPDIQRSSPWAKNELNEQFMKALTKHQCMDKSVATMKSGCTSDSCLKGVSGIVGDCVTWATGDLAEFCTTYDQKYISKYCITNELDARRCTVLHAAKPVLCKDSLTR